jgi:hypothetical protein
MTAWSRFAGIRLTCRRCIRRQNGTGFLRAPFLQQSLCHSMECGFELLTFRFTQRCALAAIDDLVQFIQVHVHPPSHRYTWLRYSRKRGVKGKPRISLIGRFGLLV